MPPGFAILVSSSLLSPAASWTHTLPSLFPQDFWFSLSFPPQFLAPSLVPSNPASPPLPLRAPRPLASQVLAGQVQPSPLLASPSPGASLSDANQLPNHLFSGIPNSPSGTDRQNLQPGRAPPVAGCSLAAQSTCEGRPAVKMPSH